MTVDYKALLFMGFSGQEHWSALPFPPPGDLANPRIEPRSPTLQANSLPSELPGNPLFPSYSSNFLLSFSAVLQLSPISLCPFSLKSTLIIIFTSIMPSKLLHLKSLMVSMMPNLWSSLKPQLPWPLSTIWHRWWLSLSWDSSLPDLQGHVTFTCCCCC